MPKEFLLIDGYNVINAWTKIFNLELEPLEDCRDRLMNILSNYQGYQEIEIIIVFDAHMVSGIKRNIEKFDNITVVYTKEKETADNYIERFVYEMADKHIVRVATSDYLEQKIILSGGGIRVTTKELYEEIFEGSQYKDKHKNKNISQKNLLTSHMDEKTLEKLEKMRRKD